MQILEANSLHKAAQIVRSRVHAALAPIVAEVRLWLESLEGRTFPVENAKEEIKAIVDVVRMANLQLFFEGKQVTLYACMSNPRLRHAQIYVSSVGVSPQRILYHRAKLPRLTVESTPAVV